MNKNDMIKYGVIAGGVFLGYWYITHYGPGGPVSEGHASYWDTWFGSATPAGVPGQTTQPGYPNQPGTVAPGTQPVLTQPSQPATSQNAGLRQQILTASAGNSAIQGGYAVPDVWSYYWQQITGRQITAQQLGAAFPAGVNGQGAPLTLDQFLTGLQGVGLSGIGAIVTTPAFPSVPSMSFGGSFRRGRGMGNKTQVIN